MSFAALSTVIAVFQNIMSCFMDLWDWSLRKAAIVNAVLISVLSLPCILGMTVWKNISILGFDIQGFEDFLVSNNLLPLGSLVYLLFCVTRYGWGWDNFIKEADSGAGIRFPRKLRYYFTFVLPVIVLFIFIQGYYSMLK